MAETTAISAFGTILQVGDGGDPTELFTGIAEIHDFSGPGISLNIIEATHQLSPDAMREFVAGLKDLTELSFEIGFVPTEATHSLSTGFLKDWSDRTRRNYRIVFPDTAATTWAVSGFVTGFDISAPLEDMLTAAVTIKLTGPIVSV